LKADERERLKELAETMRFKRETAPGSPTIPKKKFLTKTFNYVQL